MPQYNLPKGYSLYQSLKRAVKLVKSPIEAMSESNGIFGDIYTIDPVGSSRFIVTQNPELIEYVLKKNHRNYIKSKIVTDKLGRFIGQGLLTANGDYWLRQRRLIQPGFHIQKIKALYEIMKRTIDEFLLDFPIGDNIDVYPLMNKLAFNIVLKTLFNIDMPVSTMNTLSDFISENQRFVIKDIRQPHLSWWYKLNGEVKKHLKKSNKARGMLRDLIRERKNVGEKRDDLLDMLLDSRYEDTGKPMEEEQLIDEILILFIAGHETTANALSWTLHLLATHPDVLRKLRNSITDFDLEAITRDDFLNAISKESMRLFPPAWISDRMAISDDQFGEYTYPKGTVLILFLYGLHRNPQYWENAADFRPERFLKENTDKLNTAAYFPFGAGPRQCIGNSFAMAEMSIFIQTFIYQFDIKPTDQIPETIPLVTLRPDKVVLKVSKK